ncbi:plastocyanin/azurin family copper-binding protein [Polycladidibacter hongkongensis]|uniref:plastocyanin/azurin family copper-binding protein n=1 Tax=Polycladidibacter hongkongensis TaxID=1647556 RepID=UPI000A7090F6|nr:plastocyanin/azurin family copper-binding protein [Pseudovibrio hongkongensis]
MTKSVTLIAALVLACAGAMSTSGNASENSKQNAVAIDQVSDPTVDYVLDMFRFEPDFVRIPVGGKIIFNNSRGQHTVKSVRGLIPEGVKSISIANTQSHTQVMDAPGLYVMTCKVHGRYGMVMLIAVGPREAWRNPPESWSKKLNGRADEKLQQLLARLEQK